jgi:hypothetical protein
MPYPIGFWINAQCDYLFPQGIPVYAQYLRRFKLITPRNRKRGHN